MRIDHPERRQPMPDEGTDPHLKRKTVTGILIKVDWSLWGALAILAIYSMIRMGTERSGPEGRGLGGLAAFLMIILLTGAAAGVRVAARRQSPTGLVTMAVIMAWPLVFLIADPLIRAKRARGYAVAEANVGDFKDTAAASMARAIAQNDTATLTGLLNGHRPPAVKDQSGNDLLAYASPVVEFISTRQWDSALYLIEKGANLDLVNPYGVSVDYFLNEWKDSVYGEHPEGWDRVRAAIAARRR